MEKNLTAIELNGGRVVRADVFRFLKGERGEYDLVFADPPYRKRPEDRDFIAELLSDDSLPDLLADDALLVLEDDPANKRESFNSWNLLDQRGYGGCGILFYQRQTST